MTLDANQIRQFLSEKGKSREWLAVQLDCSLSTVDKVLAGRVPRGETLVALAKIVGCKVEDLLRNEGQRTA